MPDAIGLGLAATVAAPFFWAMLVRRLRFADVKRLWAQVENRPAIVMLESLRLLCAIALFGFLAPQFVALKFAAAMTMIFTFVVLLLFSRYLKSVYSWFEGRFMFNLASGTAPVAPRLAPWDAHISRLDVPLYSAVAGRTLLELGLRKEIGIIVALIERAGHVIPAPTAGERLLPGDHVSVIGDDTQVTKFSEMLAPTPFEASGAGRKFDLHHFHVDRRMPCANQTIQDCGIREKSQGLVVGIERGDRRILNPEPNERLRPDDVIWVVGEGRVLRKHFEYED
jgi:CPA2 family monovalent cation:H+ antiporter-2